MYLPRTRKTVGSIAQHWKESKQEKEEDAEEEKEKEEGEEEKGWRAEVYLTLLFGGFLF